MAKIDTYRAQLRTLEIGADRCVGRLGERAGSFVFQHGGAIERGVLRPFGYIVPGSGTCPIAFI